MTTAYLDSRFQSKYRTKKALKEAVKAGAFVTVHSESLYTSEVPDGKHSLVGPGPYTRKWYATILVQDGVLMAVLS